MAANILFRPMPNWCLIFLSIRMSELLVLPATDPVPVNIHTGVYNNSLVSSCLPTESRTISAVHKMFVSLLRERNDTDAIWLPIQRRDLGGWYWLSGEFEEMASSPYRLSHESCGVLRAADMVLADVVCDRQYHKYLCQKTASSCRESDGNCFVDAGTQYTIVEAFGSWYEARTGCYERGEQLASLPKVNRRDFLKKIGEMTKFFPDIWVGLRKMDYFIAEENASVEAYHWRKEDTCPCNSPHSCLALERIEKNIFFWKPRNCSELIATIVCDQRRRREDATTKRQVMVGGEEATTMGQVITEGGTHTGGLPIGWVVVVVVSCIILCAFFGIGLLCYLRQRYRKVQIIIVHRNKPHKHSLKKDLKKIKELLSTTSPSLRKRVSQLCQSCEDLRKENEQLKSELDSIRKNSKRLPGPRQTSLRQGKIGNNDEKCWEENPPMEMEQTPDLKERKNKLDHLRNEMEKVLIMAEKELLPEEFRKCLKEFVKEHLSELIKEYEETIKELCRARDQVKEL